jgi:hypothetical protein
MVLIVHVFVDVLFVQETFIAGLALVRPLTLVVHVIHEVVFPPEGFIAGGAKPVTDRIHVLAGSAVVHERAVTGFAFSHYGRMGRTARPEMLCCGLQREEGVRR